MATRGGGFARSVGRRRIAVLGLLALALVVTMAAGSGGGAARLAQDESVSPAERPAQVVAQGVAPLPAGEAAWRVAYHPLEPGDDPSADPRALGFVVADLGDLLVTDESGSRRTLLSPGEAAISLGNGDQRRAAAGDDPAGYFALEVVPPGADGGDGRPVFLGPSFAAPPGERDLALFRAVLAPGEGSAVPGGDAPTLVLATLGTVRVEAADGASATLRAGEAAVFGAALTLSATDAEAAVLAAVVGSEVTAAGAVGAPPGGPVASPSASPSASPAASPAAVGGSIALTLHGCPSDLSPAEFAPNTCYEDETAVALALAGGGGADGGDLIPATGTGDGPPVWFGLPFGEYELRATGFPPGYDRFFVPGLAGSDGGDPGAGFGEGAGGYRIRLSSEAPTYRLDAYAFASGVDDATEIPRERATPRPSPTAAPGTGSIVVRVFVCPGATLGGVDPAACRIVNNGFETTLDGAGLAASLTRDDADAGERGARVWDDLPFGSYVFAESTLPAGAATYYVPESEAVELLSDNSGYAVVLDEDAPEVTLDVYNLAPLSLPAPAAPPAPTPVPLPAPTPAPVAPQPTAVPIPPTAELLPPTPEPVPPTPEPAPALTAPPVVDSDGDSLTDDVESATYGTNPGVFDTDGDGTGDGAEIAAGTDPFAPSAAAPPASTAPPAAPADADADGLADADEATYDANPAAPDTDGDGFPDGAEVSAGTNPANSSSTPQGG